MSSGAPELASECDRLVAEGDFRAAWDRLEAAYLARLEAVCAEPVGWRDKLRAGAGETLRLAEAHPPVTRFMTADVLTKGPEGRERQRALADRLAALIDTARDELADPSQVPAVTARWIVGIFFDRIYRRATTGAGPDLPSQLPGLMFLAVSPFFGTEVGLEELSRAA